MKLEVIALGLDTIKVVYKLRCSLPFNNSEWQQKMEARGFVMHTRRSRRRGSGSSEEQVRFAYQDAEHPTLRLFIYNPWQVVAEFSVPRLKSGSVLNLDLVSVAEAKLWVIWVGERIQGLLPEACDVTLEQFRLVDMAADIRAGEFVQEIVALVSTAQLSGCRRSEKIVYRYGGVLNKGATRSLSVYLKGVELEAKLTRKERKTYAADIARAKAEGRVRIEHRFRPKTGTSADYLDVAARELRATLESSFKNACAVGVSDVKQLLKIVDALPLNQREKNELFTNSLRRREFGEAYVKAQVSPRQHQRMNQLTRRFSIYPIESSKEVIEIDFSPLLDLLKAA